MTGGTGPHSCRCSPLPLRPAEAPSQYVAPSYCSNALTQNMQLGSPDTSWLLNRSSNYAKIPAPSLPTAQNENTSYSTDRTDVPSAVGPATPILQMGHLRPQIKPLGLDHTAGAWWARRQALASAPALPVLCPRLPALPAEHRPAGGNTRSVSPELSNHDVNCSSKNRGDGQDARETHLHGHMAPFHGQSHAGVGTFPGTTGRNHIWQVCNSSCTKR